MTETPEPPQPPITDDSNIIPFPAPEPEKPQEPAIPYLDELRGELVEAHPVTQQKFIKRFGRVVGRVVLRRKY